jgi:hypothetical protein
MTKEEILEYLFDDNEGFKLEEIPKIVEASGVGEWTIGHLCREKDCGFCRLDDVDNCKILIHNAIKYAIEKKMSWLFV